MWSVPYNLNIYNSYFGVGKTLSTFLTTSGADSPYHTVSDHFLTPHQVGVVKLTTKFTRDMLPYWYDQMINYR